MRLAIAAGSLFAMWISAATADTWKEYDYPDLGFAVSFPADPIVEMLPYTAADGSLANEIRYSVRDGADVYSASVVDLSNTGIDDATALEHAVAQLREQGEIKLDIPARVTRHRGRQLSVTGNDGSHSAVAIFFSSGKLYEIKGTVLPESDDPGSGDAIRFQQSLRFTGDNFGPPFGGRGGFRGQGQGPGPGFGRGGRFRRDQTPPDQAPTAVPQPRLP